MTTRRTAIAGMVAALMLGMTSAGAAAPAPSTAATTPGDAFKRTELYFGGNRPDGSEITPAQFELFLDKEVTPAFLLILLYPPSDSSANRDIEEIRTDYKRQFDQESVLRADSVDRVSF